VVSVPRPPAPNICCHHGERSAEWVALRPDVVSTLNVLCLAHPRRGVGAPIARPEAVEGVAVGVLLCVVGGFVRMQEK
jgi:hypothetical protein